MSNLPLGQLLVFGFDGIQMPKLVKDLLCKDRLSGAILFKRNIESLDQVVALNSDLIDCGTGDFPTLVSVDQEGGRVARLKGICTDVPPMRTLAQMAKTNKELVFRVGAMMARELAALGFHWDFAPIMDVDSNPRNPVIGDRSFASDPQTVATLGADFIRGLQSGGVAACAKHFPGHGDTLQDSHHELPHLQHDLKRLMQTELPPFKAAVEAGVASIMTAHVLLEQLDKSHPATLSQPILQHLLRQELRFDGVIVSDDLEMKAVADRYEMKEMLRLGLNAGVDLFLVCESLQKTHTALDALHQLVDQKEVSSDRIFEALNRVAALKRRYIGAMAKPSLEQAREIVRCPPHLQLLNTTF